MEENLVKIAEYVIDRQIINKCNEENRDIKKEDVEGTIQEVLKGNNIECKTRLNEKWTPEVSKYAQSKYNLIAEVFVYEKDVENAIKLLDELDN